ncbi:Lunapark domain containing protein [Melia azedarach]|uniref:Lunapark domain containing protein n=2 Tax=Melia azedarach TaxID=155640 RepID=A0ACC1X2M3_MELAZ|nr:Lunapark domain containing protein [Melia azedarach]KAJ4705716.1 Lunapark domain containing protein [Melia azedarach]
MAEDKGNTESENKDSAASVAVVEKKRRGIVSRIWHGIFRLKGDDFEKRLQYISKEEAAVLSRMKRRSQTWKRMTRHLIIFSVIFEFIAVGYAIMTTRSMELDWKMRAVRVLPMFLLPVLSSLAYSALMRFTRMCDRKDQKTLERLRAERQAKIDELKERTNYYTTQQLIQRYDPDPAAKAAAATVLASKLGSDSGLKVYVGDESKLNVPTGKSNDIEVLPSSGLRNRKQLHTRSSSAGSSPLHLSDEETSHLTGSEGPQISENNRLVVNHHYPQGSTMNDGGWIARIAALLVGEDPTQSYALICGNCHMHNGLARKEDFPYITYYCPHCHALNKPKESEEHVSGSVSGSISGSPNTSSLTTELINNASSPSSDGVGPSNSPIGEALETEGAEKVD